MFLFLGPGLALRGTTIPNHSILRKDPSVIATDDEALYCVTDNVNCCGTPPSLPNSGGSGNGRGHWYFPHNARIPSSTGRNGRWYGSWLTGAVILNYRGNGTNGASGLFRCEVQDSTGNTQQLYICMYDNTPTAKCKSPAVYKTRI